MTGVRRFPRPYAHQQRKCGDKALKVEVGEQPAHHLGRTVRPLQHAQQKLQNEIRQRFHVVVPVQSQG